MKNYYKAKEEVENTAFDEKAELEKRERASRFGLSDEMFYHNNTDYKFHAKLWAVLSMPFSAVIWVITYLIKLVTYQIIVWSGMIAGIVLLVHQKPCIKDFVLSTYMKRGWNVKFIFCSIGILAIAVFAIFLMIAVACLADCFHGNAEDELDDVSSSIQNDVCILKDEPTKYRYPRKLLRQRKQYYKLIENQANKLHISKMECLESNEDAIKYGIALLRSTMILNLVQRFGPDFLTKPCMTKFFKKHPLYKRILMDDDLVHADVDLQRIADNIKATDYNLLGDNWKYQGMIRHMTVQDAMDLLSIQNANYSKSDIQFAKERLIQFYIKTSGYNTPMLYRINYAADILESWVEKRKEMQKKARFEVTSDFMVDM